MEIFTETRINNRFILLQFRAQFGIVYNFQEMSLSTSKAASQTNANLAKKMCKEIKVTRKAWDDHESKTRGKLYRGRPQRSKVDQTRKPDEALGLRGSQCVVGARIDRCSPTSTAQFFDKKRCYDQQSTVAQHESDSPGDCIVSKSDKILVELDKIFEFRDKDPYVGAVCAQRRSKPPDMEKKIPRQRRTEVKNAYFRKTSKTAGEKALDEGKAANSGKGDVRRKGKPKTQLTEASETNSLESFENDGSKEHARK